MATNQLTPQLVGIQVARLKKRSGPGLVPIVAARVRLAIMITGHSEKTLAAKLSKAQSTRISQQGLNAIVQGKTRRCRSALRDALAELAGSPVTSEWLGGAGSTTDILSPTLSPDSVPAAELYLNSLSPAALKVIGLKVAVAAALRRDAMTVGISPAPESLRAVDYLASLGYWRAAILTSMPDTHDKESEEFSALMVDAIRSVLEPWLEGHARLNSAALESGSRLAIRFAKAIANHVTSPEASAERAWDPASIGMLQGFAFADPPDWKELARETRRSPPRRKK